MHDFDKENVQAYVTDNCIGKDLLRRYVLFCEMIFLKKKGITNIKVHNY